MGGTREAVREKRLAGRRVRAMKAERTRAPAGLRGRACAKRAVVPMRAAVVGYAAGGREGAAAGCRVGPVQEECGWAAYGGPGWSRPAGKGRKGKGPGWFLCWAEKGRKEVFQVKIPFLFF